MTFLLIEKVLIEKAEGYVSAGGYFSFPRLAGVPGSCSANVARKSTKLKVSDMAPKAAAEDTTQANNE
jgi:hypothetical protein